MRDPWLWSSMLALSIMGQDLPGVHWNTAEKEKTKMLWVRGTEAQALTDRAQVADLLDRCQAAGVNSLALEVKTASGQLLFDSRFGHPSFDLLQAATEEASKRRVKVHAVLQLFVEGSKKERTGPAFDHPRWASIVFDQADYATMNGREWGVCRLGEERPGMALIPPSSKSYGGKASTLAAVSENRVSALLDNPQGVELPVPQNGYLLVGTPETSDVMRGLRLGDPVELRHRKQVVSELQYNAGAFVHVNPVLPEIQECLLSMLTELAKYPLDGIVVDQSGFDSLKMDFSDTNRRAFEESLSKGNKDGKEIAHWPTDVFDYAPSGDRIPGPYYKSWLEWRARSLKDFYEQARVRVKQVNPKLALSLRVRTGYPDSIENGLNWARAGYQPSFDWASPRFSETGAAGCFDSLVLPSDVLSPEVRAMVGKAPLLAMVPEEKSEKAEKIEKAEKQKALSFKEAEGVVVVYRNNLWESLGDSLLLE